MNPDPITKDGPIELKLGESTMVLHREAAVASARELLDQLPDPHQAKLQSVAPSEMPLSQPSAEIAPQPAPIAPAMVVQRASLNPLETAPPTAPTATLVPNPSQAQARPALVSNVKATAVRAKRRIPSPVQPILIAVATFSLLLFLFKLPVVFSQIKYLVQKPTVSLPKSGAIEDVVPADPTITIPKINIHSPVVYEPSVAEAAVQKALEGGIDHYGNTPAPGQGGNSVFFGHSSNDWWEPGNYKFVFILLDKLVPGDQFSIDYQGKRFVYQVSGTKVVEPTDLSVLAQSPTPTVTLITCTPPGTSWKRLVVVASQIQPDPNKTTATPAQSTPQSPLSALPGSPSSLGSQFSQGLSGFWKGVSQIFSTKPETIQSTPASKL